MRLVAFALLALPAALLAACASSARLPAAVFAETAEVLPRGHVDLTAAGGGGVAGIPLFEAGFSGGGEARVRVGVGGEQEVGVEVAARSLLVDCVLDCFHDRSEQTLYAYDVALSWKRALMPHLAIVGWLGGTLHAPAVPHNDTGTDTDFDSDDWGGLSIDAALELIASFPLGRSIDIYFGERLAVAVPVATDADAVAPSAVVTANSTVGFAFKLSSALRLYLETGMVIDDGAPGVQAVGGLGLRL